MQLKSEGKLALRNCEHRPPTPFLLSFSRDTNKISPVSIPEIISDYVFLPVCLVGFPKSYIIGLSGISVDVSFLFFIAASLGRHSCHS